MKLDFAVMEALELLERERKLITLRRDLSSCLIEVEAKLDTATDPPDHRAKEHRHEETAERRAAL